MTGNKERMSSACGKDERSVAGAYSKARGNSRKERTKMLSLTFL